MNICFPTRMHINEYLAQNASIIESEHSQLSSTLEKLKEQNEENAKQMRQKLDDVDIFCNDDDALMVSPTSNGWMQYLVLLNTLTLLIQ